MIKRALHIISKKFWAGNSYDENRRLKELLLIVLFAHLLTLIHLIFNLLVSTDYCIPCDIVMVLITGIALTCLLNNRSGCVVNLLLTIPLFIYVYNIADFSSHPPLSDTIYHSLFWLIAGSFAVIYFAKSDSVIILYSFISIITLLIQLLKADILSGSFMAEEFLFTNPVVIFLLVVSFMYILRSRYKKTTSLLHEEIKFINKGILNVFRSSKFPVIEIKAELDEEENVVSLKIEKVNNAFESAFTINYYEVKDQEANYIFELIFRDHFDINKLLLFENPRVREYHAKKLERWYKIQIIKPHLDKYYIILEDVTKARKKTEELEDSKKRYKVLLEAIPDMFFVIGKDGIYEDFVIKESDLFKLEDINIVGSSIYDVGFPENMADKIHSCIQNSLKNNTIESIEYSLKTPHGNYMFEMRLAKLNSRSVISVARDITRRKNAEFNLERARKKAEDSDRLKSVFLSNLSHEIRTPLNIITNFTRMLNEGSFGAAERTEIADAISQNSTQLLNMINNTIHLSRIETDSIEISTSFCEINNLMRDVYNRFKPLIPDGRQVNMDLYLDVPNSSFGFITDERMLKETLQILVDNAVKYTVKGTVNIGYKMLRNEHVNFFVSDTGIGIPKDEIENIFSRFYRVKNQINEDTSGSGIGLPIAQHYISLLGGELQLETEPGRGTTFSFSLSFKEGQGYLRVVI